MKKFECKYCKNNCILTVEEHDMKLRLCPYSSFPLYAGWHEVVDSAENEQSGNSEQLPSNPRKLPDWANVGKWMYNIKRHKYCKILHLNQLAWISDEIKNGDYIKARERPFNAEEMKALVGKVLEWENNLELVISYNEADVDVYVDQMWCSAKYLMDNEYTIDGKPCYKLEHLENGEWVE